MLVLIFCQSEYLSFWRGQEINNGNVLYNDAHILFNDTLNTFIYGYMAWDIWL